MRNIMIEHKWIVISIILALAVLGYGCINYVADIKYLEYDKELIEQEQKEKLRMEMMYDKCVSEIHEII